MSEVTFDPGPGGGLQHALSLHQAGRLDEAAALYRQILATDPEQFDAWHFSGVLALQQGDAPTSVACLERAVGIRADVADAWCNLGLARITDGAPQGAIDAFGQALALDDSLEPALHGIARAYLDAGQVQAALSHAARATELAPQHPNAWRVLGEVRSALGDHAEAAVACRRALKLHPNDPELAYNLGVALEEMGQWRQGAAAYERALEGDADLAPALANLIFLKRSLCDWQGLDALQQRFRDGVAAGRPGLTPFALLAFSNDRAEQLRCAETFAAEFAVGERPFAYAKTRRDRITIGYLSSGFYRYPTATLIPGVIEAHDRERFRILCLSTGPDDGSEERRRLERGCDEWLELRHLPASEAARRIHEAGVDILVDLKGYANDAPTAITALRPAPITACWVGYPGTTGADFVDYLIADGIVIRAGEECDYREAVVRLAHCYQPNDEQRLVPEVRVTRSACGLPEDAVVFCCFNQPYKLGPDTFDSWMEILNAVPDSILWLLEPQPAQGIAQRLKAEAAQRGTAGERLVFAPKKPREEYLDQLRLADLMLDTLPYNAHTNASDALWMGCPVLTCPGETFAGRVAASLLRAAGLEQLIAPSTEAYRQQAIQLARDPAILRGLRRHLEAHRGALPLFDTARVTREVESAYQTMMRRRHDGLAPAPFSVGSGGAT